MLRIHVHPGARREQVQGWRADGSLKLAVAAPPEGGRANEAVSALLAEVLGVRAARVIVVRGRTSRAKTVEVEGLSEGEIRRRVEAKLAPEGATDAE